MFAPWKGWKSLANLLAMRCDVISYVKMCFASGWTFLLIAMWGNCTVCCAGVRVIQFVLCCTQDCQSVMTTVLGSKCRFKWEK